MIAYFLSDLHLGAPYFPDSREAEKRVVAFLDSIKYEVDAIYLLGDVLDYWYEYRYVVPRGFVRFFGKLAELSDAGVKITWFIGNHDIWIFDYLPNELGIRVVDGTLIETIDGVRFFMTHGDGVGNLPKTFRVIRSIFRNKVCQKLFSGIHPRWTVPFAYKWSDHSRNSSCLPNPEAAGRMTRNYQEFSGNLLKEQPDIRYFIFGHIHLFGRYPVEIEEEPTKEKADKKSSGEEKAEIVVLGEWLQSYSYARWDGKSLTLHKWGGAKTDA
ncbi:MAG: UDP-2,3-diacylglucosamine diphosphatase [Muribaculaceae bacterium]|nr:UDP-2,3-diacylglucosamine diphosphatase [Muribaculaceae bacterium]